MSPKPEPMPSRPAMQLDLGKFQPLCDERLAAWEKSDFFRRFWAKDFTLWTDRELPEIVDRMGWLQMPERMRGKLSPLISFADEIRAAGFVHVVLLGMGGSSLAPEFFQKTFGRRLGYPELLVLDSTHPQAVRALEKRIDIERTLFLVSSKSGTTSETLSFFRYFWSRVAQLTATPGERFAAITDPGTSLALLAGERKFRRLFEAHPEVGGRYSALSEFGLVPAALIGVNVGALLASAAAAANDSSSAFLLGAALGEVARQRDKLTILTSPSLSHFPDWLEQLLAESTGKDGKGVVPVVDEPVIDCVVSSTTLRAGYGNDRFFAGISFDADQDHELGDRLAALARAGFPVIRIRLGDIHALGEEIFRWEIATAAAGSVLGIHPFNQPDVESAKEMARKIMARGGNEDVRGESAEETVPLADGGRLKNALKEWLALARPGDYFAVQAYLAPGRDVSLEFQEIRSLLLQHTRLATTFGYGPRFLHSTGQLHKGGPNCGLFLQIVDETPLKVVDETTADLAVPESGYSFGALIRAQSLGDFQALRQKGRRVLRLGLGHDAPAGLRCLRDTLASILASSHFFE